MRADIERAMPDRAGQRVPAGLTLPASDRPGATQHMRILTTATCLLLLGTAIGCARNSGSVALDSDGQKASYAIGYDLGQNLLVARDHLDMDILWAAIQDALAERDHRLSDEEVQTVMTTFNETLRSEMEAENLAEASRNLEEGVDYLEEHGARDGVTTTASGLQYEVLREGEGASPGPSDRVTIQYRGTLIDGTEFDSSYERGEPATFAVSNVIPGFSEGLQLMPTGSHYRFVIPGDIGYGSQGAPPDIGPNATLIFEVELLEIAGS